MILLPKSHIKNENIYTIKKEQIRYINRNEWGFILIIINH